MPKWYWRPGDAFGVLPEASGRDAPHTFIHAHQKWILEHGEVTTQPLDGSGRLVRVHGTRPFGHSPGWRGGHRQGGRGPPAVGDPPRAGLPATDENIANLDGLDYSPKLAYGLTGKAAREATIDREGTFVFDSGKVDFAPEHKVIPGNAPNPFPPKVAEPGSVGDADYSPLVHVRNASKDLLFNAPMLAFNVSAEKLAAFCNDHVDHSIVHDKVVAICPRDGYVTLALTIGFTFSKPILYLSTEANDPLVATLEGATYTPAMKGLPFALEDASPGESAERIYVFVNGPMGLGNPQRQGLDSALSDGRGPLNILGGIPTINLDYSPMWRLFPAKWTPAAIEHGYRSRMTDAIAIEDMAAKGFIKGIDGGALRPVGFVVNCPVVYRIN